MVGGRIEMVCWVASLFPNNFIGFFSEFKKSLASDLFPRGIQILLFSCGEKGGVELRHATLSCIFKGINLHFCLKKMIRTTCWNTHSVTAHTHLHWVRCSVNQNMILVGDRINAECFGTLQPFRPLRQTERFGHFSYINSINES